jgi:hypothetical protein
MTAFNDALASWLCEGQDQAPDMNVLYVQVPFLDLASGDARIYRLNGLRGEPFYNAGSLLVQYQ